MAEVNRALLYVLHSAGQRNEQRAGDTVAMGLHLWPDWPTVADRALWVLAALTTSAGMMFVLATAAIPRAIKNNPSPADGGPRILAR